MSTRRNRLSKRNKTRNMRAGKNQKTGKKWVTAIDAASKTLEKTGSITAAKKSLKKQALFNARKLFGSI
jgi:soluble cytochrome b562